MSDSNYIKIEVDLSKSSKSIDGRIECTNRVLSSALEAIKSEKLMHPDNCEDLKFIVEDFLYSLSDPTIEDFNYLYTQNGGENV
jgi:hypothetical protein